MTARKRAKAGLGMYSRREVVLLARKTTRQNIITFTIAELVEHFGGDDRVTVPQRLLIEASAVLVMRLRAAMDKYLAGEDTESIDRHFCSLQNSLRLNLLALGLERPKEQLPTLHAYLEAKRAA